MHLMFTYARETSRIFNRVTKETRERMSDKKKRELNDWKYNMHGSIDETKEKHQEKMCLYMKGTRLICMNIVLLFLFILYTKIVCMCIDCHCLIVCCLLMFIFVLFCIVFFTHNIRKYVFICNVCTLIFVKLLLNVFTPHNRILCLFGSMDSC